MILKHSEQAALKLQHSYTYKADLGNYKKAETMKGTAPSVYNTKTEADCHTTSYPTTSATTSFHTCVLKLCQENI